MANIEEKPEVKKDDKKEEQTVEIPRTTLDTILEKLEKLEKENKDKGEKIDMLTSISDKGRLTKWEEQNKGALIRTASISIWEGNPILAWKMIRDEVGFRDGRLVVNQTVKLYVDKGGKLPEEVEVDYLFWAQNTTSVSGEVVEKSSGKNGELWTIELKDGRKIKIDIRFINAF